MVGFGGVYNRLEIYRENPIEQVDTIRYNPNFVLLLASGPMASTSNGIAQRQRVVDDVIAIHTDTTGDVFPDIGCNIEWKEAETALGVYDFVNFERLKTMTRNINIGIGLDPDDPADVAIGCKWWVKLFHRNYGSDINGNSTPIVPAYMQQSGGIGYAGGTGNAWSTGGIGANRNGEYEGTLGAGSGAGNKTRAAKLWVPDVALRLQAWLQAIGAAYNNDPSFAGVIINETSPLNALPNGTTGMTTPGDTTGAVTPTSNASIMYQYFQNLFGAVVAARPSLSKCELMISANSPVASIGGSPDTMYTMLPFNPSVLYTQYQVGNLVQDSWAADDTDVKLSVKKIYQNNQPHAVTSCSYACLLSPDTRRHKGVDGSEYYSATSVNPGTGIPGNKSIVVTKSSTDSTFPTLTATTMQVGKSIVLLHDVNKATQAVIYGTISAYNASTGACTVNATSATGTGARTGWEVGIPRDLGDPNYLPPHTLDQLVTYAVTPRSTHSAWVPVSNHNYEGATHVFFQVTQASTGTAEGQLNYVEYVEYLKTTTNRVKTARPDLY